MNNEVKESVQQVIEGIAQLDQKSTLVEVIETLNKVIEEVNKKGRDRGPKSTKSMSEELANKVLLVEPFCNMSHKKCAIELGLAYGQVSSVRGGYTFKRQYREWEKQGGHKTWSSDYVAPKS